MQKGWPVDNCSGYKRSWGKKLPLLLFYLMTFIKLLSKIFTNMKCKDKLKSQFGIGFGQRRLELI